MTVRRRVAVGAAVGLALAALAGPLHLRARAQGVYQCMVPLGIQRALKGGPGWPAAEPLANRDDRLSQVSERLTALDTRAFVVIQDDQTVFEAYERCHGPFNPHYAASASKALVGGLATAVALDSGWVDLDEPAAQWVPSLDKRENGGAITLRHLGTHASGMDKAAVGNQVGPELPGWKGRFWGPPETRWQVALTEAPLRFEPGARYLYSNPAIAIYGYALSAAVDEQFGRGLDELLRLVIMEPLGVDSDEWSISDGPPYTVDGQALYWIGGGAAFSARAMAALGQLVLDEGRWGERALVSSQSLSAVTSYQGVPEAGSLEGNPAPGIGWHSNREGTFPSLPPDAILAAGAEHQVVLVVPSRELVVVRSGGSLGGPKWGPGYWSHLEAELFQPVMSALDSG